MIQEARLISTSESGAAPAGGRETRWMGKRKQRSHASNSPSIRLPAWSRAAPPISLPSTKPGTFDKRKALGVSRRLVPDGLSGNAMHSPAVIAQAMIEQMGDLSRQLAAVKTRAQDQESQDRRPLSRDWQGRPRELNPMLGKRR